MKHPKYPAIVNIYKDFYSTIIKEHATILFFFILIMKIKLGCDIVNMNRINNIL